MIFVALLICEIPQRARGLEEIVAIGETRQEAIDLVMDAWRTFADQYGLDPSAVNVEDVASYGGAVGDAFINGFKI